MTLENAMGVCIEVCRFKREYFDKHAVNVKNNPDFRGLRFKDACEVPDETPGLKEDIFYYKNNGAIINRVLFLVTRKDQWNNCSDLCYELTKETLLKLKGLDDNQYGKEEWERFLTDIDKLLVMIDENPDFVYTVDWA